MGYLFLDIETFVDEKNPNSGLNPFEKESKILLITYNYYAKEHLSKEDIKPPNFLKEWESNEKDILTQFYEFIKDVAPQDIFIDSQGNARCGLKLIGYNIIGFDSPYLFSRMLYHKIDTNRNLVEHLIKNPVKIDLMQISIMLSKKASKFNTLLPISQATANEFFKLPMKEGTGLDVSRYYRNKEYDKIIKYATEEFTFESLYLALKDLVITTQEKVTYKESIFTNIINRLTGIPIPGK